MRLGRSIADWLEKLGLSEYAQRFVENDIDFTLLPDLTDQDLEKIGIASLGQQTQIVNASTSREIEAAFAAVARERPDAGFLGRLQLANWAARHALPMTSGSRDICEVGGLMSYGSNIVDVYRQQGVYVGRILKGAKPADLLQSAKFEFVINLQTARALGFEVPPSLLGRADEVIE